MTTDNGNALVNKIVENIIEVQKMKQNHKPINLLYYKHKPSGVTYSNLLNKVHTLVLSIAYLKFSFMYRVRSAQISYLHIRIQESRHKFIDP